MYYVIGSGPSGIACAKALLDRGLPVTMVDAGLDLESEKDGHRRRLAASDPSLWPEESVAIMKAAMHVGPGGVPLKRVFGSDFPFRVPQGAAALRQAGAHALRSFARGGLSRTWGATLLPIAATDARRWPVPEAELAPHYRAIMQWMPLAAAHDGLDALFPMHCDEPGDLRPSRQAIGLLGAMSRHHDALTKRGVTFGRARLAVQAPGTRHAAGCVYCRLCLHGCPYGSIFSADQTIDMLGSYPRFRYRGGLLVRRVDERADEVRLEAIDLADEATHRLSGTAAFLACGVLTTSQLLMDALSLDRVRIQTSQSFLMPLLARQSDEDVRDEQAHALSQIYLLVRDTGIAERLVQLQIYTYSDLVSEAMDRSMAGPIFRLAPALKHAVENRLVVLQGLLPSEQSDALVLDREGDTFSLRGGVSPRTRDTVQRVARLVRSIGPLAGFRALTPFLRLGAPGQSFHSGGSFPMSARPDRLGSDLMGRPGGLRRIHAVDATVLPDIPATPLTFTVMANAHRIGSRAE